MKTYNWEGVNPDGYFLDKLEPIPSALPSFQHYFKKSFTSFSHSTRNKTRDGHIRVRNIRALNGRFNTSITHAYSIVIGNKHITLNATGGGFLTASKQFRHGATSKSRSNTASNSTKHKSPHLSGWRQIISLIT